MTLHTDPIDRFAPRRRQLVPGMPAANMCMSGHWPG